MNDVDIMNLFKKEDNEELKIVEKAYHDEMEQMQNNTIRGTREVQEKYEEYFSSVGTELIAANPKEEDLIIDKQKQQDGELKHRVQLTGRNKELIEWGFDKLVQDGLAKIDNAIPICIECGKSITGLGLKCENDNSVICWDCVDSQNYIDYKTINICKFGGN